MKFTKGNVPWNKNINGSEVKSHYKNGFKGLFIKGIIPWNKDKTDVYSEETKQQISESLKGNIPWNKNKTGIFIGDKNPFYGKKHTEESINKMSESHKGCVSPMKDKHHSEATKLKWSKIRTGKQKGASNPAWKGGVTPLNKLIRRTKEYLKWAINIYKRDKYICQECGIKCNAGNIIAHHIYNFADFPELRFSINNGITLCRSCHIKYHKLQLNLICE